MENSVNPNSALIFYVNGQKIVDKNIDPEWNLLFYLRKKLNLTGTKLGCGEGGCGACTVMVSKFDRTARRVVHFNVNACLAPICFFHGLAVTTVEGIGSVTTKIHPVQERIAKAHGIQCGFCTPGIVMSMYTLLRSLPGKPSVEDMHTALQGNLCRCTGYRTIIEGFHTFTEEWEQDQLCKKNCTTGSDCCSNGNKITSCKDDPDMADSLFDPNTLVPYDPSQEPIFPSELQISSELDSQFIIIRGPRVAWFRPTTLSDLLQLKSQFPSAKLVNGGIEIQINMKFKNQLYPELIQSNHVPELTEISQTKDGVRVGAATTLSALETFLKRTIAELPEDRTKVFQAMFEILHWIGGKQIRNLGTVGGNITSQNHPSDLSPILMAAGCQLELISRAGKRLIPFSVGFEQTVLKPEEILLAIIIPYSTKNQFFASYKQTKRRDDDFAVVNAAFNLYLNRQGIVENIKMTFGGIDSTINIAPKTEEQLKGKLWACDTIESVFSLLMEEIHLNPEGGNVAYRYSLIPSLLFKFFLFVTEKLENNNIVIKKLPDSYRSGIGKIKPLPASGSKCFEMVPESQEKTDFIGRPIVELSSFKQATGEAIYCEDMPDWEEQLYLSLVYSTRGHARILNIDESAALALPGVHAFYCSKDLPGERNIYGVIKNDNVVFADQVVECIGQVIGAVVADNWSLAQRAAKLVKVDYEDLHPVIVTIEDAIRENSYYPTSHPLVLRFGNPEEAFFSADHVLEGELKIGAQEHFYMETLACIVVPKGEDDDFEIFASSQNPTDLQQRVAHMLGIPSNRVVVKVKRIGGAFGAKGHRCSMIALPCALAARRLGKPIRCILDRNEDMATTGFRHPFLARYKISFKSDGRLTGCVLKLYNNAGRSLDVGNAVMKRAMLNYENAYYIPNVTIHGYVCKTNITPNSAFRGFGVTQGMLVGETMITHVASYLKMDPIEIRSLNLFRDGLSTHFNNVLTDSTLDQCWQQVLKDSDYKTRQMEVQQFNKNNRFRKRGISVVPTMYGIGFGTLRQNHGGALVLVYKDGSVLLSHGGTEMGQGLYTKMIQVASGALGVPVSKVHTIETGTDKVPNTEVSGASSSADLNGAAILDACRKILERLEPIKNKNPDGEWKDWVKGAYLNRISLAATGFYKTPDLDYNFEKNEGRPFNYFCFGAACSEVEIDCLTGDHQILRTDIVMDVGQSINPGLDIGQVEGAFIQGYGMFTMEELVHSAEGELLTKGPGSYKIPTFSDIPGVFNVCLLKGSPNPRAVYSSKAVGEPPLFLAASVFFAIREAIEAARAEVGLKGYFRLDSPATAAQIRLACADRITEKVSGMDKASLKQYVLGEIEDRNHS